MRNLFLGAIALSLLASCEQNDIPGNEKQTQNLRVEAEISSNGVHASRTATTDKGTVTFAEGDNIGFYMPEADLSGSWTYSKGSWSAVTAYVWPDVVNAYDFCAYYPFTQPESRSEISMPDLTQQDGTWDNLSDFDFLVARCTTNYRTHSGVVTFTGDEAFKHLYALVSITIKGNSDTNGATLSSLSLTSDDLMTAHTYHFGASAENDGTEVKGESRNEFTLGNLSDLISSEGHNHVFIVNPVNADRPVKLTVNYTRDMKNYTVSTNISGTTIQEGSLNNLTIRIKKSGLVVEGNTVQDWTQNTLPETDVDEILVP